MSNADFEAFETAALVIVENLTAKTRRLVVDPLIASLALALGRRFRKQGNYIVKHGLPYLSEKWPDVPKLAIDAAAGVILGFSNSQFVSAFYKLVDRAYRDGKVQAASDIDLLDLETMAKAVSTEYDRYVGTLTTQLDNTTGDRLESLIADAIEKGNDFAQLKQGVLDQFRDWADAGNESSRASMIALNEIALAYNRGMLDLGRAAGDVLKEWWTDGSACEICEGNAGEALALEEPFASGDDQPPAHPNCRCGIRLVKAKA